jgi:peptidylprolyl isomerase
MPQAEHGSRVKVHYTGKLDDGTVFDSSEGREPLAFTIGLGQMIPGFEQGVVGMEVGESKVVQIPAEQAYGEYRPEGVLEVNRTEIPPDLQLEVGIRLQATQEDGRRVDMQIIALSDDTVTLDANHPLAGKDLTFDVEVVEIS